MVVSAGRACVRAAGRALLSGPLASPSRARLPVCPRMQGRHLLARALGGCCDAAQQRFTTSREGCPTAARVQKLTCRLSVSSSGTVSGCFRADASWRALARFTERRLIIGLISVGAHARRSWLKPGLAGGQLTNETNGQREAGRRGGPRA